MHSQKWLDYKTSSRSGQGTGGARFNAVSLFCIKLGGSNFLLSCKIALIKSFYIFFIEVSREMQTYQAVFYLRSPGICTSRCWRHKVRDGVCPAFCVQTLLAQLWFWQTLQMICMVTAKYHYELRGLRQSSPAYRTNQWVANACFAGFSEKNLTINICATANSKEMVFFSFSCIYLNDSFNASCSSRLTNFAVVCTRTCSYLDCAKTPVKSSLTSPIVPPVDKGCFKICSKTFDRAVVPLRVSKITFSSFSPKLLLAAM